MGRPVSCELTDRQREAFLWIEKYISRHGISPTLREIQEGLGKSSIAAPQSLLTKLRERGYLDWQNGKIRTIRLLKTVDGGDRRDSKD